ncbi:MAG: hypothetical protein ACPG06_11560 [Alphaproteobacteria bacterium]
MPTEECISIVCHIKEWQTLIAGILALIGATITIVFLRMQINQQQRQFDHTLEAAAVAARARLPHALSDFCDYTERVSNIVANKSRESVNQPYDA